MLPPRDQDGEHEHPAGGGERQENNGMLGRLLGADIDVHLGAQRSAGGSVRVEEGLAAQQEALPRARAGHGTLDRQGGRRPFAEPALLRDPHRKHRSDEIGPRRQLDRGTVATGDLLLPTVVRGQEHLISAVEVPAKP